MEFKPDPNGDIYAKVAQLEAQCRAYEDALDQLAEQLARQDATITTLCHLMQEIGGTKK